MKKLLLLLCCVLTIQIATAQQPTRIGNVEAIPMGDGTITFRDAESQIHLEGEQRLIIDSRSYVVANFKNGLPNGSWELFRNNALAEKLNYVDGLTNGVQTFYFADGTTIQRTVDMTAGKMNGKVVEYFPNGKINKEGNYKAGKEDGISRVYGEDGTLRWDCFYANGLLHGKQTQAYSSNSGDYVLIASFQNGVPIGKYTETFTNGTVGEEGEYDKAGKKTGRWIERNQSGKILSDQSFQNGELDGPTKTYFTTGAVNKIIMYANGKKNGLSTEYYSGTEHKVKSEINYANGLQHGVYKWYYDTGKVREEGVSERDETVSTKTYYENGQLRAVKVRRGGSWETIEEYDYDGKKQ